MTMFDKPNSFKKFIIFFLLLAIPGSMIIYFTALITKSTIACILVLGLLSIPLRIIVDEYGDKMLTDPECYMNEFEIEEFGKKKVDLI